jgi:hypothetical protein
MAQKNWRGGLRAEKSNNQLGQQNRCSQGAEKELAR